MASEALSELRSPSNRIPGGPFVSILSTPRLYCSLNGSAPQLVREFFPVLLAVPFNWTFCPNTTKHQTVKHQSSKSADILCFRSCCICICICCYYLKTTILNMALGGRAHESDDDLDTPIIKFKRPCVKTKSRGKKSSSKVADEEPIKLSEGQPRDEVWPRAADLSWGDFKKARSVRKNTEWRERLAELNRRAAERAAQMQFVKQSKEKASEQNLWLEVLPDFQVKFRVRKRVTYL